MRPIHKQMYWYLIIIANIEKLDKYYDDISKGIVCFAVFLDAENIVWWNNLVGCFAF